MSFEDICERLKTLMLEYFIETDKIIDNIITDDSTKVLSAKQGVVLKELIDNKTPVLVDSATLKVCEEPDVPVEGYEVGDKYVDFLLFTEEEEHIYCLLTEFVKCDGLEFSNNKVTEITNESTHEQYPSAKSVYDFHDSSKVSVNALDESVEELGYIKTSPVQADWGETDPTKLAYIRGKPNLHSILVGKVADVVVENGKLKVTRFEESDIPTGNIFIRLISSSQYVTSSESFILQAILVGEDGVGISGETIRLTGSDGSSYSDITDNQGVCSFNIFSIDRDVTFTVTYKSLSSSVAVELVLFYDKGSSTHHKDNYTNTGFTRSFHEDYTTLTETVSGVSGTYKSVSFPQDCIITLKIKCDGVASNGIIRLFNGDTVLGSGSLANVGLTQDGQFHDYTITCTSDGKAVLSSPETSTTLTRTYTPFTGNISFGFWSSGDTEVISFKDIIIKEL